MTDLLVTRCSFSDPRVQEFGASSPAAHDVGVERTPPRDENKPKENRPSDPVSRTMKAVLSCSPGNPKNQWKMRSRPLRLDTQIQHALAGEEIMASKCSIKPGCPVGKQAAGDMAAVYPRSSPRVRRSKQCKQRKDVHIGSNSQEAEEANVEENRGTQIQHALAGEEIMASKCSSKPGSPVGKQAAISPRLSPRVRRIKQWQRHKDIRADSNTLEAEEAYTEKNSPLLADKSGKQANRMSPKMRRSKQLQQHKDVHSDSNTQEATEAYEETDSILLIDKRQSTDIDPSRADDDEPDNKTDNCNNVNVLIDQSSPPGDLLAQTDGWTGEKRAKVVASSPTSRLDYYRQLFEPCDKEKFWDVYEDPEQLNKVHERLALYRIKANELFWEGKELDIAQLKEDYSSDTLRDEGYFEHYEMNREWYFNPEYCKRSALDDYQRLVLRCDVDDTYINWESYHRTCATLKCDLEFLQFYEELSSKLKSIEDDDVEPTKEHFDAQRTRYDNKAHDEAPKIAARFCNISAHLVYIGVTDSACSAMFDIVYRKDLDRVLFEIWKRIAKDKVDFRDALEDLYKRGLYPLQHRFIKAELEEHSLRSITMKDAYYTHLAHIDEKVPENEVLVLIKEAVDKIDPKPLTYVDYVRKKMEVAKEIGVIS